MIRGSSVIIEKFFKYLKVVLIASFFLSFVYPEIFPPIFGIVFVCFLFTREDRRKPKIKTFVKKKDHEYNINLIKIEESHWEEGDRLLKEGKYKESFEQYLIFIFWKVCGVVIVERGKKVTYAFAGDKWYYETIGKYETHVQFYGNIARCLEYSDISRNELEDMVLTMPIEKDFDFPFTPKELLPYYLKAYDKHKREKKKFEKEYGKRYMIRGKIK